MVLVLLAGCANESGRPLPQASQASTTSSQPTSPPATTPGASVPPWRALETWTFVFGSQSGYSSSATVELGAIGTLDQVGALPSGRSSLACAYDPERDLVVSGRAVLTNTSTGFSATLGITMHLRDDRPIDRLTGEGMIERIDADMTYGSGPSCIEVRPMFYPGVSEIDNFGCTGNTPRSPGDTLECEWYLVIHDVRTPSDPDGRTRVADLRILIDGTTARANPQKVTTASGPCLSPESGFGRAIPLGVLLGTPCPRW